MVGAEALLDREEELLRIQSAVATPGTVLVVEGEAGIGKTALLEAGSEFARGVGTTVLTARGGVLEREFGYGVARQLFERPLRASPRQRQRWLAGAAKRAHAALGLDAGDPLGEAADPVFAAQHGLYWLVANMADDNALVLVIDDLHWVDLASFHWLVYLARRLSGLPVTLLAGWRSGEPGAPQALLDEVGGERLAPRALGVWASASLVGRALGRECDNETARACQLVTGGNPLLLSHLAEALDADVELPLGADRIAKLGSRAAAAHVRSRLASFRAATVQVATAAAVFDGEVAPRHVAELTALPLHAVRFACDELVRGHLMTGRDTLAFAHPLVRAAIYDELTPTRRAAVHRRAADILDEDGQSDRAAVHLVAAERVGDASVVDRLVIAAGRASSRGAVDEAVVLLRRALEEPPPPAARYSILAMLAQAEWHARDEAAIEHAYGALALADGAEQRAAAAITLARLLSPAGRQQEAVDVLARTAGELRSHEPQCAVRLDVQRVAWSLMLSQPPHELMPTVLSLTGKVVPGTLTAHVLNGSIAAAAASLCALPAASIATIALDALADNRMLEDLSVTAPFCFPLVALAYCERLDECSDWLERRQGVARRSGSRVEFPVMAALRAHVAWLRGDLVGAEEEARDALAEAATSGFSFFVPYAAAQLVATLVERGECEEATRVLADHHIAEGLGFAWTMLVAARASLALALGDIAEARAQLSATPSDHGRVSLRLTPVDIAVCLAGGATDEAGERARAMLAVTARFGASGAHGIAQRLLALATGGADGLQLLRDAIASLQLSPRRLELARALVDYGAALRRSKQRAAAREPLRRGLDLAHRCGATVLADRAEDELRATGARPRRVLLSGLESLTPSELRVARLVAQGHSNPEVAQRLFVTRATVETHLHAVYRKLDIGRREQLAAALDSDRAGSGRGSPGASGGSLPVGR